MKAILLSAGLGTRLKPITDSIPKCLVPVGPKPIIDTWLGLFERAGVEEVLINLHHHPDLVRRHLGRREGKIVIRTVYEKELLGSLGTVLANKSFYAGESEVLIVYVDNFAFIDFRQFAAFHAGHTFPMTVGVFETPTPKECGIIELDREGTVVGFEEKPQNPRSNLANAGIYLIDTGFLNGWSDDPGTGTRDIGFHFLPRSVGRMKAYRVEPFFHDIGTIERLRKANAEYEQHASLFAES